MSQCLEQVSPLVEAHCERLDSFAVLDPARWNALAQNIPFRQWEWVETWWRHYRNNRQELFLLVVHDSQGDILGIAPWYLERSALWGRVVRFLGSGKVCSDYVSILCRPEHADTVTHSITEWLTRRGRFTWDLLDLEGLDDQDQIARDFIEQLEFAGLSIDWRSEMSTWRTQLPATFDPWVAQLSKSRREKVRALVRRLFDTGRAVSQIARTAAEVREAWRVLRHLHALRRESLGQTGCFAFAHFEAFHDEIIDRFHQLGQLRLHTVTLDGFPVAAEYDLVGGDVVYMYQTGFDPQFAEHQPGWLNTIGTIRQAIDQGFTAYDFMRGDEPYKAHWRAQPRRLWRVRVVADHWGAKLRNKAWWTGRAVRGWMNEQKSRLAALGTAKNTSTEPNSSTRGEV